MDHTVLQVELVVKSNTVKKNDDFGQLQDSLGFRGGYLIHVRRDVRRRDLVHISLQEKLPDRLLECELEV